MYWSLSNRLDIFDSMKILDDFFNRLHKKITKSIKILTINIIYQLEILNNPQFKIHSLSISKNLYSFSEKFLN